jgi:uncharacterized protein YegL
MRGEPIRELAVGLVQYKDELLSDSLATKRVDLALVTFGGIVRTVSEFGGPETFLPPTLMADGDTPMGGAIRTAIDMIRVRKEQYRANGIMFYRPWIFMITDGAPTDEWATAAQAVKEGERTKSFAFFSVGVQGANMDVLRQISTREPLKLVGLKFRDLFQWLSNSQQRVSQSNPGDEVPLPAPTGWSVV